MDEILPVGIPEIAERLGVGRPTVDQWIQRELLPPRDWTVGGRPAWNWPTIRNWAQATGRLRHRDPSTVTGVQVAEQMLRHITGRRSGEAFDLVDQSRRAAAVLLGERENDLREEIQMRVIEVSLRGIATVCDALGIDPDELDEQPTAVSTVGQARAILAAATAGE